MRLHVAFAHGPGGGKVHIVDDGLMDFTRPGLLFTAFVPRLLHVKTDRRPVRDNQDLILRHARRILKDVHDQHSGGTAEAKKNEYRPLRSEKLFTAPSLVQPLCGALMPVKDMHTTVCWLTEQRLLKIVEHVQIAEMAEKGCKQGGAPAALQFHPCLEVVQVLIGRKDDPCGFIHLCGLRQGLSSRRQGRPAAFSFQAAKDGVVFVEREPEDHDLPAREIL